LEVGGGGVLSTDVGNGGVERGVSWCMGDGREAGRNGDRVMGWGGAGAARGGERGAGVSVGVSSSS